jgi:hypothetical protein
MLSSPSVKLDSSNKNSKTIGGEVVKKLCGIEHEEEID